MLIEQIMRRQHSPIAKLVQRALYPINSQFLPIDTRIIFSCSFVAADGE